MWLNLYEAKTSLNLVVRLKLKCWLKKPTHDDIIEAKEYYIQLSFWKILSDASVTFLKYISIKWNIIIQTAVKEMRFVIFDSA